MYYSTQLINVSYFVCRKKLTHFISFISNMNPIQRCFFLAKNADELQLNIIIVNDFKY